MAIAKVVLTTSTRKLMLTGLKLNFPSEFLLMCTSTGCKPVMQHALGWLPILTTCHMHWQCDSMLGCKFARLTGFQSQELTPVCCKSSACKLIAAATTKVSCVELEKGLGLCGCNTLQLNHSAIGAIVCFASNGLSPISTQSPHTSQIFQMRFWLLAACSIGWEYAKVALPCM